MLEDEDDGAPRSLVRSDMATAQTKFRPYTRRICLEIVQLPNVIVSPDALLLTEYLQQKKLSLSFSLLFTSNKNFILDVGMEKQQKQELG